jgi:hypothetical protein
MVLSTAFPLDGRKETDSYVTHLANPRPSVLADEKDTSYPWPWQIVADENKAEKQLSIADDW